MVPRLACVLGALWLAAAVAAAAAAGATDFTEQCPAACACKWQSGNKAADCAESNLTRVPPLSADIQILDLSGNPLYELRQRAFRDLGISNLKKLLARSCHLQSVQRDALAGLAIMIELDLSRNEIASLAPDTFRETDKIRWILLNHNRLEKLDDGLFRNLLFLQKVELADNRLLRLGVKTFSNVPKLTTLRLSSNRLSHVKAETLDGLRALASLDLDRNPWRCDCTLQPFRTWVLQRNLYTAPTACAEPARLAGKPWNELDAAEFACRPSILRPARGTAVGARGGDNVTLACLVSGDPLPDVSWVRDARVLGERPDGRHLLSERAERNTRWSNLTVTRARAGDAGRYRCVARNAGGVDEREVSLSLAAGAGAGGRRLLPLLAGVCAGGAVLLLLALGSCYCCCRRRAADKLRRAPDALLEGSVIPEMEKSALSAVNPVSKPPRRYDTPLAAAAAVGATEMADLNKTLLDNDSVFAEAEQAPAAPAARAAYPPDLLAFPPRAPVSPASSASTAPDSARLAPLSPPAFRTLPHARSPARHGYVTIPRRPRAPSWASAASAPLSPLSPLSPLCPPAAEPLYDNLGVRTTADGSSVLSLVEAMRARPLPPAPAPLYASSPRASWAASPTPAAPVAPARRTPPRPPPKPRKKPESSEPLFEDEGEDGTEV